MQFGGEESAPAVGGVLSNDTDVDGDPLTVTLVDGPDNAQSFTLNQDGTFTYTPTNDFNGIDTFTYTVSDGFATSNTATVTITVNPVNDAPVLDNSGSPVLTQINEGDIDSAGDSVAAIIASAGGDPITDVDSVPGGRDRHHVGGQQQRQLGVLH